MKRMKLKQCFFEVLNFLRNILFPPRCVFCDAILEPNVRLCVCGSCGSEIEFCSERACCEKCGKPIVSFGKKQLCYFCANTRSKKFDRIVSVFSYEGLARDAVLKFKSAALRGHLEVFCECISARIAEEYAELDFDLLCGVMPHSRKNDNDSVDLLCKRLAARLNVHYERNLFAYQRITQKQSSLGWKERQANLKESIAINKKCELVGKTVLLLDDVCTTRATIMEYSRALKSAGAKRVFAVTLATVKNPQ